MNTNTFRYDNNKRLHDELLNQIHLLNPDWHITLTWHTNNRTYNIEILKKRVIRCMTAFERAALGRNWFRKHLPFIMVAERHADGSLHAHLVLNAPGLSEQDIHRLFYMSEKPLHISWPEIYITPICSRTPTYVLKQIQADCDGRIDTDAWIPSAVLLEMGHKKKRHRVKGYQKYNINIHNHIEIPIISPNSSHDTRK